MSGALRIEKLGRHHDVEPFDCGRDALNRFPIRYAFQAQQAGASQSYLAMDDNVVAGFYTLVVGQLEHGDAAPRLVKGLARHPVPIMILARLAIGVTHQGRGLGAGLLKDAMLRTLQAADIAGIRALVVHAKDEDAIRFYRHFEFEPSPTDPFHLFVLLKDVRRLIGR